MRERERERKKVCGRKKTHREREFVSVLKRESICDISKVCNRKR